MPIHGRGIYPLFFLSLCVIGHVSIRIPYLGRVFEVHSDISRGGYRGEPDRVPSSVYAYTSLLKYFGGEKILGFVKNFQLSLSLATIREII